MINPLRDQPADSDRISPPIWVDFPHSIDIQKSVNIPYISLLKNGENVGYSASYEVGDTFQIAYRTPSLNETGFLTYLIDGVLKCVPISTYRSAQYPYQFKFVDNKIVYPGSYSSSTFKLYRLNGEVKIGVGDIYSSEILKNGISMGKECLAENGDVIEIKIQVPDMPGKLFSVPCSVGHYVDYLEVYCKLPDQEVDTISFQPRLGVDKNTSYLSNEVLVSGLEVPVRATSTCPLYLNGIEVATPVIVSNGDKIKLNLTSSNLDSTASFGILYLGDRYFVYPVITKATSEYLYVADQYLDQGLFDVPFTPDNSQNSIGKIEAQILTRELLTQPTGTQLQDSQILIPSYFENKLYVVDSITLETQRMIDFPAGSNPFSLTTSPNNVGNDSPRVRYLTLCNSHKVVELEIETYQPYAYHDYPCKVYGIGADGDGYLYVATENGVFLHDTILNEKALIDTTTKAYEVYVHGNRVFVSYLTKNLVKEFESGLLKHTYQTGLNPLGMTVIDEKLYICNSSDNTLSIFDLNSRELIQVIQTLSYPIYCSELEGKLAVAYQGIKALALYDKNSYALEKRVDLPIPPYGIENGFLPLLYTNTPARVAELNPFTDLPPIYNAELNKEVSFELPTYHRSRHLSLPDLPGLKVELDGTLVGRDIFIPPNGKVKVLLPTGDFFGRNYTIYCAVNSNLQTLTFTTSFDSIPNWLEFGGAFNVFRRSIVLSEEITVEGITAGNTLSLTYEHPSELSTILVNGEVRGKTVNVTLGDKLQLQSEVVGICGDTFTYPLKTNGQEVGSYTIGTFMLDGPIKDLTYLEVSEKIEGLKPKLEGLKQFLKDHFFIIDREFKDLKSSKVEYLLEKFYPSLLKSEYLFEGNKDKTLPLPSPKLDKLKELLIQHLPKIDSAKDVTYLAPIPTLLKASEEVPNLPSPEKESLSELKFNLPTPNLERTLLSLHPSPSPKEGSKLHQNTYPLPTSTFINLPETYGSMPTSEWQSNHNFAMDFLPKGIEYSKESTIYYKQAEFLKRTEERYISQEDLFTKFYLSPSMAISLKDSYYKFYPKVGSLVDAFYYKITQNMKLTFNTKQTKFYPLQGEVAIAGYQKSLPIKFKFNVADYIKFYPLQGELAKASYYKEETYPEPQFKPMAVKIEKKIHWHYTPTGTRGNYFNSTYWLPKATRNQYSKLVPWAPKATRNQYSKLVPWAPKATRNQYSKLVPWAPKATINHIKTVKVQTYYIRIAEGVQYDLASTRGLYPSIDKAEEFAKLILTPEEFKNKEIYTFQDKVTFRTPADLSIVCILPVGEVLPTAGYLSGG